MLFSITLKSVYIKTMIIRCLKANRKNHKLNFKIKKFLTFYNILSMVIKLNKLELTKYLNFEMVNKWTLKHKFQLLKYMLKYLLIETT